jgi:hypothetical protein
MPPSFSSLRGCQIPWPCSRRCRKRSTGWISAGDGEADGELDVWLWAKLRLHVFAKSNCYCEADVVRAWKDPDFRATLSSHPRHPAGQCCPHFLPAVAVCTRNYQQLLAPPVPRSVVITVDFGPEKAGVGGSTRSLATISNH